MARLRLRGLVYLIDPGQRSIVYTDFADTAVEPQEVELKIIAEGVDKARFREKTYAFLKAHEDDVVLFKLRSRRRRVSAYSSGRSSEWIARRRLLRCRPSPAEPP